MHGMVYLWVKKMVDTYHLRDLPTLEIGAYNVNGTVADLFTRRAGVDMRAGPGVDEVHDGESLPEFWEGFYSVAVATETLEHVARPWLFVAEMARVVGPGGFVIVTTCDFGFPRHDFPSDYYRWSPEGLDLLLETYGLTVLERSGDPGISLYRLARKLLGTGPAGQRA